MARRQRPERGHRVEPCVSVSRAEPSLCFGIDPEPRNFLQYDLAPLAIVGETFDLGFAVANTEVELIGCQINRLGNLLHRSRQLLSAHRPVADAHSPGGQLQLAAGEKEPRRFRSPGLSLPLVRVDDQ